MKNKHFLLAALSILFTSCLYPKFMRDTEWRHRILPFDLIYRSDSITFSILSTQNFHQFLNQDTILLHFEGKLEKRDSVNLGLKLTIDKNMQCSIDSCFMDQKAIESINIDIGDVWRIKGDSIFDMYLLSKEYRRYKVIRKIIPAGRHDDYLLKIADITPKDKAKVKLIKYRE